MYYNNFQGAVHVQFIRITINWDVSEMDRDLIIGMVFGSSLNIRMQDPGRNWEVG